MQFSQSNNGNEKGERNTKEGESITPVISVEKLIKELDSAMTDLDVALSNLDDAKRDVEQARSHVEDVHDDLRIALDYDAEKGE